MKIKLKIKIPSVTTENYLDKYLKQQMSLGQAYNGVDLYT